jgi:hypothetical protein
MSKPRYHWWAYVRAMVRLYPRRLAELRRRQEAIITPNYSAMPRGSEASRTTENLGLATLGPTIDREVAAVGSAIHDTHKRKDGDMRLALVNMVYWEQTHSLPDASRALNISDGTGRNWNAEFMYLVAKYAGVYSPGDWRG